MNVSFSHMVFYIKQMERTLVFYQEAFALPVHFIHESGQYAELKTGATKLAFATEEFVATHLVQDFQPHSIDARPAANEICFTTEDVSAVFSEALSAGAREIAKPAKKPWGQTVALVRDPEGILIEIASPV